ncbi:MAG: alpha-ribazole phosphatase [Tannerellaceae bacterium]|nr:alpha-ribazole phosphatase [Tannerellaceae bacterium]
MELYIIRHTAVDVPAGYAYGQTDVPLKSSFEEEAKQVLQQLSGISFDKVYTSPLSRCVRLAGYCGYPDARQDDRLKELHFGSWEMKSWDEVAADPHAAAWFDDWMHVSTPEGESYMDQYHRVSAFLEEIRTSGMERVAIFTHGGVQTCAQVYAKKVEFKDAFKHVPAYGEIMTLIL